MIALSCSCDGAIQQILRAEGSNPFHGMSNLRDVLDPHSAGKVNAFLADIGAFGAAFNWELRLEGLPPETWTMHGLRLQGSTIVLALSPADAVCLQLSEINNELVNHQRLLAKQNIQLQELLRERYRHTDALATLQRLTTSLISVGSINALREQIGHDVQIILPTASALDIYQEISSVPLSLVHDAREAVRTGAIVELTPRFIVPLGSGLSNQGLIVMTIVSDSVDRDALHRLAVYANTVSAALERLTLLERLSHEAITDPLTSLYNRRGWAELAERETARSSRSGSFLSAIMVDLDSFKVVNDTYGHVIGDVILTQASTVLRNNLRTSDILGRHGGEEFIVLLPDTRLTDAVVVGEKLRRALDEHRVHHGEHTIPITISVGVATIDPKTYSLEQLVFDADSALIKAKRSGRNKVCY